MKYNWQLKQWPKFNYNIDAVEDFLAAFSEEIAHVSGMLKAMSEDSQIEAVINTLVLEAIKTSEIEGEYLSRPDVVSSIRNNLGLNSNPDKIKDKKSEGAGALMVAVRNSFAEPLTEDTLFKWHIMLLGHDAKIRTGAWRTHTESMQVISGAMGQERIHFEAPPSADVPIEMRKFIKWFNDTAPGGREEIKKAAIRSAIAHLYFEFIHPFEDGNGRIGRAIAEKALSQTLGRPILLSLSQAIEADKKSYYAALERNQRTDEVTDWITYFVKVILDAQVNARKLVDFTLAKTRFFDRFRDMLNERQLKVIKRMLEEGPQGFKGGMTTSKYISLTRASKATATRDLQVLAEMGVLKAEGGGRSTHYMLVI